LKAISPGASIRKGEIGVARIVEALPSFPEREGPGSTKRWSKEKKRTKGSSEPPSGGGDVAIFSQESQTHIEKKKGDSPVETKSFSPSKR